MEPNNLNNVVQQGQQVQGGTVQFDQMTGKKLSQGQFSNPVGALFDINTGKKIPTSLMKEDVRPLTIPTAVPDTSATGLSSYVDSIATPTAPVTAPQAPSRKRLTELTQKLGQESSLLNRQYEKEGVFTEQDTVNTIRDEITAETNATNNRIERLRNESKGMTQEAIAGEVSRIERDSASKKADLAIALSLAERRFDRVKGIADRKVEIELAPIRAELELEKTFYEENKDLFTEQERRAFELKQLETKQEYDTKKQTRDSISDIAVTIAGNGAPANVVSAVLNAQDQESAILAAGTYFQKPVTGKGTTLNTINGLTGNPFYDALANASIGLPENQRIENNNRLTALINAGQEQKARELIKRTAYQTLTGTEKAATIERSQAIDSLTTIKDSLNEYVAKTGDTNILTGTIQDIQRKIGTAGDPELAKIGTRITQALQIYRSSVTGAAWGEQEDQEYNQLFPSFKNTNKLNTAIVDGMLEALNANNRVYLETVLGGKDTYDAVFKADTQATTQPVVSNNVDLTQFQVTQPQTAEQFFQELNTYQLPDFSSFFK